MHRSSLLLAAVIVSALPLSAIGEATKGVSTMTELVTKDIVVTRLYDATPEALWTALTTDAASWAGGAQKATTPPPRRWMSAKAAPRWSPCAALTASTYG